MSEILSKKQFRDYSYTSRYNNFPYYYHRLDDKYVYGSTAWLKDDTPYTLYKIRKGDTWDILSLRFYDNPTFFWILCEFNHVQDPYSELVPDKVIKVPTKSSIEFDKYDD